MANVVYGQMGGTRDPLFGKFEHKIKAVIQYESDQCEKDKNAIDFLYKVEKSNSYSEAYTGETEFDTFMSMGEGQSVENDSVDKTFDKVFTHNQFGKSFAITRQMVDDSKTGMSAAMRDKPSAFVRAFYKTRVMAAQLALANGTSESMIFNRAKFDLRSADGMPLFSSNHKYASSKHSSKKQSNYFYASAPTDAAKFSEILSTASVAMRNFKDENYYTLGYTPDTIVIPGNRGALENMVNRVCGSERMAGTNHNDINTNFGNWNVVVLNNWVTDDNRFMLMSTEANKNLNGNMFFNRVNLEVNSWVDYNTYNYMWSGYARFGLGFNSWKHMSLCVLSDSAVSGATQLK